MAGRRAELQYLKPSAEQIDVVDGLRALIAAIDNAGRKEVCAILLAEPDILRPQRNAHLFAGVERMQQRRLPAPALAEVDDAELAIARDQRAGEFVGGAGEIGDEQIGRPGVDLVGRADL